MWALQISEAKIYFSILPPKDQQVNGKFGKGNFHYENKNIQMDRYNIYIYVY